MTWRFRKRIKLLPGLWINLSKGAPSLSIGGKGVTTNIGKKGVATTLGIPGTGLSYRFGPKRTRKKSTFSPPAPPNPLAEKGRKFLDIINEVNALPPIDEQNPLPGLQERVKLNTEQLELVGQMQALRPGEPIERVRKKFEAMLEWNRWTQINFTDHTEESADAEKSAGADFEATKLTDGALE
jgi:Protein of unknown function (DUF4236)